ncbi:hypothetical protein NX059_001385 [Plenodomus lindquistii]|nr:hypothetical protein NX059_001385 [Plenodomus lindquistii]
MIELTFGVEIETLVRPKLEISEINTTFQEAGWNFSPKLSQPERNANSRVLRQYICDRLVDADFPAHLNRRDYREWIMDRDGTIVEEAMEDKSRPFCNT